MNFGIRKSCITTEDGEGVLLVEDPITNFDDTVQGKILAVNRMDTGGLKYKAPNVKSLGKANLTLQMKEILMEYMDPGLMNEDLNEVWQYLCE